MSSTQQAQLLAGLRLERVDDLKTVYGPMGRPDFGWVSSCHRVVLDGELVALLCGRNDCSSSWSRVYISWALDVPRTHFWIDGGSSLGNMGAAYAHAAHFASVFAETHRARLLTAATKPGARRLMKRDDNGHTRTGGRWYQLGMTYSHRGQWGTLLSHRGQACETLFYGMAEPVIVPKREDDRKMFGGCPTAYANERRSRHANERPRTQGGRFAPTPQPVSGNCCPTLERGCDTGAHDSKSSADLRPAGKHVGAL